MAAGLRVAVDAVAAGAGLLPGAGPLRHTTVNLVAALADLAPHCSWHVLCPAFAPLHELSRRPNIRAHSMRFAARVRPVRVLYQNTGYALALRRVHPDVTLHTVNVAPPFGPRPRVVMLRSLQCFTHPRQFGWLRRAYLQFALRRSLLGADRVVAGTSAAARDAQRLLGLDPKRLRIVPHGLAPHIASALEKPPPARQSERPYLLAVSALYGHKNYPRLLQAFASLRRRNAIPHHLHIVGADADLTAADLRRMATDLGIGDAVALLGPVPHDRIAAHYQRADALVYVSLAETFGHPPLEAMALGCPVIASNTTSLPEITGGAAQLVDPTDVQAIASAIERVVTQPRLRAELVDCGRQRARDFTWTRAAQRLLAVLGEVANASASTAY
ncbi:MAG: glycosyltransferase family 1 protein [Chloroflexota bacterium]|nr:glycosyltransferase family 1 protein [Chloroflexota bacterium]MDE2920682.1 glycosyltransferase family 1 protein [Chloroflexota bacterium]